MPLDLKKLCLALLMITTADTSVEYGTTVFRAFTVEMDHYIPRVKSLFFPLLFIVLSNSFYETSISTFLKPCEALSIVAIRTTSDATCRTKGSMKRRSFPTIMQAQRKQRYLHDTLRLMSTNPDESNIVPSLIPAQVGGGGLIGDDSAYFSFEEQRLQDWVTFVVATGAVLVTLSYFWFLPIGPHWGDAFLSWIQDSLLHSHDPAATIFAMLTVFAISHSGLASLRPSMEGIIGARSWRVIFACVSLPLALSCISYFVNHAHEGAQLWDLTSSTALHNLCRATNFVSFLLLYPSTFNLLEIAAVERPQLHLWETGVIRITRHPQAWGQILWCAAHTLWLGSSVALAASTVLVLHHMFSMWNGDRRLRDRHGDAFDQVQAKTSIVPFAAILDGRQRLPNDYYKELLRPPYLLVVGGTIAAYWAHPYMMAGAALLHW